MKLNFCWFRLLELPTVYIKTRQASDFMRDQWRDRLRDPGRPIDLWRICLISSSTENLRVHKCIDEFSE